MNKRRSLFLLVPVIVVAAIVIIVFAGGHKGMDMSSGMRPVATNHITIASFSFSPMSIKITAGTTVTWMNHDKVNHTVTADTPSANTPTSMDIGDGKSYSYTFKKAGTYTYHCFPHPYMHGTVIVTQ